MSLDQLLFMVKKIVYCLSSPTFNAWPPLCQEVGSYDCWPHKNHVGCIVGVMPAPGEGEDVERKEMLQMFTKVSQR